MLHIKTQTITRRIFVTSYGVDTICDKQTDRHTAQTKTGDIIITWINLHLYSCVRFTVQLSTFDIQSF